MITLAQAQTMLERYSGYNNSFTERINLVCERLMKAMNARSTKDTVLFNVYPDELGRGFITLPRQYNTVLAGVFMRHGTDEGRRCGYPIAVRDEWFSFLETGPGYTDQARFNWSNGFIPEVDRFTTFKDWATPKYLRLKFATTQAAGTYNIRGRDANGTIYTGSGANMVEGENLATAGASTLTTASLFIEPPYAVFKPESYGPVKMYTWDGSVEELVAVYDPLQTVPELRRYRIPACTDWTEADPGQYLTVCKREWVPIGNANDQVIPGNIGALRFGLNALLSEDSQDFARAEEQWQKAYDILAKEAQDDTGANAHTPVQMADSFMMNDFGQGWGMGWGGNGFWNQ